MTVVIEMDQELGAAYVRLSDTPVVRTIEFSEHVIIDLNEFDVAVGLEVLDATERLPFEELTRRFHVREDVVELLRQIQPDVGTFVDHLTQGSGGVTPPDVARQLASDSS